MLIYIILELELYDLQSYNYYNILILVYFLFVKKNINTIYNRPSQ